MRSQNQGNVRSRRKVGGHPGLILDEQIVTLINLECCPTFSSHGRQRRNKIPWESQESEFSSRPQVPRIKESSGWNRPSWWESLGVGWFAKTSPKMSFYLINLFFLFLILF